jgi:hypothetical protein
MIIEGEFLDEGDMGARLPNFRPFSNCPRSGEREKDETGVSIPDFYVSNMKIFTLKKLINPH